mgnify:CR=1 FL=1
MQTLLGIPIGLGRQQDMVLYFMGDYVFCLSRGDFLRKDAVESDKTTRFNGGTNIYCLVWRDYLGKIPDERCSYP